MPALRALPQFDSSTRQRIDRVATDAMERGTPTRLIVAPVIAPVVVDPKAQKEDSNQSAVDQRGRGEIKHPGEEIAARSATATKKRAGQKSGAL